MPWGNVHPRCCCHCCCYLSAVEWCLTRMAFLSIRPYDFWSAFHFEENICRRCGLQQLCSRFHINFHWSVAVKRHSVQQMFEYCEPMDRLWTVWFDRELLAFGVSNWSAAIWMNGAVNLMKMFLRSCVERKIEMEMNSGILWVNCD